MMRLGLATLGFLFALGACATSGTKRSYTPKTVVVVKGSKKRSAEANYQASPEDAKATGSGGSAK
jgi:hypothetical protein